MESITRTSLSELTVPSVPLIRNRLSGLNPIQGAFALATAILNIREMDVSPTSPSASILIAKIPGIVSK